MGTVGQEFGKLNSNFSRQTSKQMYVQTQFRLGYFKQNYVWTSINCLPLYDYRFP